MDFTFSKLKSSSSKSESFDESNISETNFSGNSINSSPTFSMSEQTSEYFRETNLLTFLSGLLPLALMPKCPAMWKVVKCGFGTIFFFGIQESSFTRRFASIEDNSNNLFKTSITISSINVGSDLPFIM